jgi:NAD-dependent dihydropyrimidine dehydrogenase PreA subunit
VHPAEPLSYRQIRVGPFTVGMNGLDELFAALHAEVGVPDLAKHQELLERARRHNYIPTTAEEAYAEALVREYRAFCQRQDAGCGCATDYGTWRGHPRERIPWYPEVHAGRCDGCGACVRFCPNGVFAAVADSRVRVVEPLRCQVGCRACVRICKPSAITFPPQEMLEVFAEGE